MGVVNFAHGAFYMLGAVVGLVGAAVERVLIRPLYSRSEYEPLLLTFGLTFVVIESVKFKFGKIGLPFDAPPALNGAIVAGKFAFPLYLVFLGVAAIVVI